MAMPLPTNSMSMSMSTRNSFCQDKVVEVSQIAPPFDSPELLLPLTYFDMFFLKSTPWEQVYYYGLNQEESSSFSTIVLPKLKQSLSLALSHYLPLAGRLLWPANELKPAIHYTQNDAVSLTFAESEADHDFEHLLSNEISETRGAANRLVPKLETGSVMAFKVTLFPNSGFSIGYSLNHAAVDGISLTMFMKSWAYICKQQNQSPLLPQQLVPLYDRTVIKDPEGLDIFFSNKWENISKRMCPEKDPRSLDPLFISEPSNLVRGKFALLREDIERLRARVVSLLQQQQPGEQIRLSSFVLAYAYALVCMVKSMGDEKVKMLCYMFPANCRGRLDSIPENYFGNCIFGYGGLVEAKALMGDRDTDIGVALMAKKISELVRETKKSVLDGVKDFFSKFSSAGPKTLSISVAGSPAFDLYAVDFGWGRPRKVSIACIDTSPAISIESNGDENGGIEIGIALEKNDMETFASLFVKHLF